MKVWKSELAVLRALQTVAEWANEVDSPLHFGICAEAISTLTDEETLEHEGEVLDWITDCWLTFREASGDPNFPVPSPDPSLSAQEAYNRLHRWSGPYGACRRRFLYHCIAELEVFMFGEDTTE